MLAMAFARFKNSNTQWQMVTLNGLPCASDKPVIEYMVEKMREAFLVSSI